MRNDEPRWEDTAEGIENHHLDQVLGLPPLLYVLGLFQRDGGLLGLALVCWAFAVLIWTPWIIIRVAFRAPPGDTWRATAVLGIGLLPWTTILAAPGWLISRAGLLIGVPLFILWGGGAMAAAVFEWPRRLANTRRQAILIGGGLVYSLVAAFFLTLAFGDSEAAFIAAPCVVLGGVAAVAAGSVFYAASRPGPTFRSG